MKVDRSEPAVCWPWPPESRTAGAVSGVLHERFAVPAAEYDTLTALKRRAAALQRPIKKSQLLRAGIQALAALSDEAFLAAMATVPVPARKAAKRG